ncbi:hypothetical protein GCM10027454_23770 [Algoriphagus aestuariicola]
MAFQISSKIRSDVDLFKDLTKPTDIMEKREFLKRLSLSTFAFPMFVACAEMPGSSIGSASELD